MSGHRVAYDVILKHSWADKDMRKQAETRNVGKPLSIFGFKMACLEVGWLMEN